MIRLDVVAATLLSDTELAQRTLVLSLACVLVLAMSFGFFLIYGAAHHNARFVLTAAVITVAVWLLVGFGFVFGAPLIHGFLGNPVAFATSGGVFTGSFAKVAHAIAFFALQGSIAVLTVVIVASALEPVRRFYALLFIVLWLLLVYVPIAYSIFNMRDGWLFSVAFINDQGGGTAVHIAAGAAVLALFVVLGPRRSQPARTPTRRVAIGSVLAWFGAFGLSLGAEGRVDGLFSTIAINILVAPSVAVIAWVIVEFLMSSRATLQGAGYGVVAGVVAITPACNILTTEWAVVLGLLAGACCAAIVTRSNSSVADIRKTVVGIQLVGGTIGVSYIGLLGNGIGWKDSGQPDAIATQTAAALGVAAWSFVVTLVASWILRRQLSERAPVEDTAQGYLRGRR